MKPLYTKRVEPWRGSRHQPLESVDIRVSESCTESGHCEVEVDALDAEGRLLGRVGAMHWKGSSYLSVDLATMIVSKRDASPYTNPIAPPGYRSSASKGVGTRLYEELAQYACKKGLRVRSDTSRTPQAQSFWAKQERKGRARWKDGSDGGRFVLDVPCSEPIDLSGVSRRRPAGPRKRSSSR